jgi:hypothetical protein
MFCFFKQGAYVSSVTSEPDPGPDDNINLNVCAWALAIPNAIKNSANSFFIKLFIER